VAGADVTLDVEGARIEREPPGWVTEIFSIITDPTVAFLLMTIGFYGLFFELTNPGAFLPGTIGVIALILGLYALSVLPVNLAGAALLLVGVVLMGMEAFVPSFGALGIGGLVAFALGASLLFDTNAPGFRLSWQFIIAVTAITGGFVAAVLVFALGAQRRVVETGLEDLLRQIGVVDSWDGDKGWVFIHGERWRAVSDQPLDAGQKVRIEEVDDLTLKVAPVA
jgi:membrane-bound serine protease (ClpP class)